MENLKNSANTMKNWLRDDRPREKLLEKGASVLSDAELIAILLQHGYKSKSALDLAREVLQSAKGNLNELGKYSGQMLTAMKGIGPAKAALIMAAIELGRRRQATVPASKAVIRSSADIAQVLQAQLQDYSFEVFAVVYLNRANKINQIEIVSKGGITGTVADPRIILRRALEEAATGIILCHNHPSGSLRPSQADLQLTQKIAQAARLLDIDVKDHLIVSEEGYFSFADEGLL